ncbi:MAG TPA: DUF6065 family protein [Casimicrobiaceae bacterium]|nr:DUF6065 family protein [Casimicrobiaceae bacterium]
MSPKSRRSTLERLKITFYALTDDPPELKPASATRAWMDATPDRHAYRCLPLAIANVHGWDIASPCAFDVEWNGGDRASDLTVRSRDAFPAFEHFARSHFANGVVTLHVGYLVRTDPGWHTLAGGPLNAPKDGIVALTGVIESDWLPYPFTMNWRMTRAGSVRFERGETICSVFPVKAHALTRARAEIRHINDDPELRDEMKAWAACRAEFMANFEAGDPATIKAAWQRYYFKGQYSGGAPAEREHAAKLRVAVPVDMRGRKRIG